LSIGATLARKPTAAPVPPSALDELASAPADEALDQFASCRDGLTATEAALRRERDGANELAQAGRPFLALLAGQLKSPLLGLLTVAAAASIAVGEHTSGAIILAIVGLSVGLGLFNEYRSEQTLASLRSRTGRRATVLRDRGAVEVAAAHLVRGDVCLLQVGDVVPADLRLLEASELTIDEAALSGEAYPANKQTNPGADGVGAIHANCAYLGSIVRRGRVVAIGIVIPYSPVAHVLGFRPLPLLFLAILAAMAATYLALAELAKAYFFRSERRRDGRGADATGTVGQARGVVVRARRLLLAHEKVAP
jgi:Mg2+-importing ATPase